jgi:2-haloacid dehalogenase
MTAVHGGRKLDRMAPPLFVFDAYGTLFDVHSAVARHAAAIGPEAARLSEIWRAKQLEQTWVLSLAGRYQPFWMLTERALTYALARCPQVDPGLAPALLDTYRSLDAYPEVPAVLESLRQGGAQTAILSNGDHRMLEEAVDSAGVASRLDALLSVESVQVFKTDPRTYALVGERFGVAPGEVTFVSSNRWDVAGAAAFGFRPIWVNRGGLPDEYPDLAPALVVSDLSGLV